MTFVKHVSSTFSVKELELREGSLGNQSHAATGPWLATLQSMQPMGVRQPDSCSHRPVASHPRIHVTNGCVVNFHRHQNSAMLLYVLLYVRHRHSHILHDTDYKYKPWRQICRRQRMVMAALDSMHFHNIFQCVQHSHV